MLGNILINPKNQDIHAFGQSLFCLPCVMKKGNILQGEITILAGTLLTTEFQNSHVKPTRSEKKKTTITVEDFIMP